MVSTLKHGTIINEQSAANVTCLRCHGVTPHTANNAADLNKHTANVACEVCHIPSMNVTGNIGNRAWAPYTLDPRTSVWTDTSPVLLGSFFTPYSQFIPVTTLPLIRWFNGSASMLAQPAGSYTTRESTGGSSKLYAFKPFVNGIVFDAGWLPGPSSDPGFDYVHGTWTYSMKGYYENNWAKFLALGFVDSSYTTAKAYWQARPDMAQMLNNFPMMLYMDRSTFQAEAGTTIGTPIPGIAKAINLGMGRIGIEMGYFPASSDPFTIGATFWSGRFFGMWVPVNMDPTSPFYGELNSFITMSHSIKGAATLGTTTASCYTCHYTSTEYDAQIPLTKRLDFAQMGWPNVDNNNITDPLYDRIIPAPIPDVDRIAFDFVTTSSSQTLKIMTYIVDTVTRVPMENVTVSGTLAGPNGQPGLPYTVSKVTGSGGKAIVTSQKPTF